MRNTVLMISGLALVCGIATYGLHVANCNADYHTVCTTYHVNPKTADGFITDPYVERLLGEPVKVLGAVTTSEGNYTFTPDEESVREFANKLNDQVEADYEQPTLSNNQVTESPMGINVDKLVKDYVGLNTISGQAYKHNGKAKGFPELEYVKDPKATELAKYIGWHYGDITADAISVSLNALGTVSYNNVKLHELVNTDSTSYNTVGKQMYVVQTTTGMKQVKSATYGARVDEEATYDKVITALVSANSVDVFEPIYTCSGNMPSDYVLVDKTNQHVTLYEHNTPTISADCVTGRVPDRETPSGVFYISEWCTNKILRGRGYASHVDYWMRLTNSGVGLHDAKWRSHFGGTIYERSGSHGCVNLPHAFAKELFSRVSYGTVVVVV